MIKVAVFMSGHQRSVNPCLFTIFHLSLFFFLEQEVLQINLHAAWESSLNL